MGRLSEPLAALFCATLFLLWRFGYPLTPAAGVVPFVALILVGTGIYLRRTRLTLALREGIFLPGSRYKRWFQGRLTGVVLAATEGTAIVTGMCHFTLHADWPQLILAGAIGICTLSVIAFLRALMTKELRPEFAVAASAWMAAAVALPFCFLHFRLQQEGIISQPEYVHAGSFMETLRSSLAELPDRRDGIIEILSTMQLLEAAIQWMLKTTNGIWGVSALLFLYNSAICLAIARFFADAATTFNLVRVDDE